MNIEQSSSVKSHTNSTIVHDTQSMQLDNSDLRRSDLIDPPLGVEIARVSSARMNVPLDLRLLNAAQSNERQELQALLAAHPDMDISTIRNQKMFTLLHFATFNNQFETIQALIRHYETFLRDDIRLQTKQYINLQTSDGFSAIHFAAYRGNITLMEFLFEKGADVHCTNEHGMNIMHIAAQGDQPIAVIFAHQKGISISSLDNKGGSPLHWACFYGCEQSTIYLLSLLPPDPPFHPLNVLDHQLLSPLHLAVMSGNTRLVKKLLVAGADRTVHGKENKTPADMAQEHEYHNIHSMLTKQDNALIRYYNIKQGFKRKRKSPRELVRFALIFMYQCGTFGVFVVDIDTVLHNYFLISVLSMIVLVLILFIVLVCMDPGSMKQGRHSLLKLLKTEECYNVCATCATIKLPRSKHCDVCQRCVMVYDHHCPWINNCIGARNHAVFVLFVFMLIVCMSTTTYLVVDVLLTDEYQPPYIQNYLLDAPYKLVRYTLLGVNVIIGVLFIVALFMLFYTQMVNICTGKTTLERFAFKATHSNLSSLQLKTTSQPSIKNSLLGDNNSRFRPRLTYSLRNCIQMCCINRIDYQRKERQVNAVK